MTDELLPCPFCASRNVSNSEGTRNGEPFPYVECESCGATSEPDFWNRRAFPAPTQPVRAAPEAATEPSERAASLVASEVPKEIAAIIENLHTQDNRITDNPLFAVQQKRRFGGVDSDYADASVWISDGCEVDAEEAARLDALRDSGEAVPDNCQRMGYIDRWEFVTGCLTEQGCKDYIARNGHNLHEPRIYAYGSYRNAEFIAIRKWLMSLRDSAGEAQS
jgi:hypothetical protein